MVRLEVHTTREILVCAPNFEEKRSPVLWYLHRSDSGDEGKTTESEMGVVTISTIVDYGNTRDNRRQKKIREQP